MLEIRNGIRPGKQIRFIVSHQPLSRFACGRETLFIIHYQQMLYIQARRQGGRGGLLEPPFWLPKDAPLNYTSLGALPFELCSLDAIQNHRRQNQSGCRRLCLWRTSARGTRTYVSRLRHCYERTRGNTCVNKSLFQTPQSSPVVFQ